jgi:hypothetical protein
MRVNGPRKLREWLPVFRAMPSCSATSTNIPRRACSAIATEPSVIVQYWRSLEGLDRFVRDTDDPHLAPWRRYVREVGSSGDLGIRHEKFRAKVSDTDDLAVETRIS